MLKLVRGALEDLGLVASDASLRYCINITTGESISISAFIDAERFCQIKSSRFVDLAAEYLAYSKAWANFPDFVPQPLAFIFKDPWSMTISVGIHHSTLSARTVLDFSDSPQSPAADLLRFFEMTRQTVMIASAEPQTQFLQIVRNHFDQTQLAPTIARALDSASLEELNSLPLVYQHGDFVINNLAQSANRLIIFDWEDYGKVTLCGLDLATLMLSVLGDNDAMLVKLNRENAPLTPQIEAFLRCACSSCGIEFEQFRRLIPVYLAVFLYMKRNYGIGIQLRIATILAELTGSDKPEMASLPQNSRRLNG